MEPVAAESSKEGVTMMPLSLAQSLLLGLAEVLLSDEVSILQL